MWQLIKPRPGNLRLWHAVGSVMVLGQWLCAGAVLWRVSGASGGGNQAR